MRRVFQELARVVRPGGVVAFEVGEVRGGKILLERHVINAIAGLPFEVSEVMINRQRSPRRRIAGGSAITARGPTPIGLCCAPVLTNGWPGQVTPCRDHIGRGVRHRRPIQLSWRHDRPRDPVRRIDRRMFGRQPRGLLRRSPGLDIVHRHIAMMANVNLLK